MKSVIRNIIIILILLAFFACEDPAPIEITNVKEEAELEVVNPDPTNFLITGYDSTGIIEEDILQKSVISLSGIKNTVNSITVYRGYGEAVFFDTTKPVLNNSKKLIGYKTFEFRNVKFGNIDANIVPFRLKFRENNMSMDTLIGVKHEVSYKRVLLPQNLNFPYNQNLNIELSNHHGNSASLNIRVPEEITGKVEVIGTRQKRNQKIKLSWNRRNSSQNFGNTEIYDEIIVGGVSQTRDDLIPLFRIRKLDSNQFEIPNSFIEDIYSSRKFEYIVFTFLRKIRKSNSTSRLGDIYFASQSIHNIWIKI